MHWVYRIEIEGITRYIGYSEDLTKREKQHNYLCFKKMKKKILYDNIRKQTGIKSIELRGLKSFKTRIEAKRFECFLILNDYFNKKEYWQRVPRISDI